jgi:hypothetical protein
MLPILWEFINLPWLPLDGVKVTASIWALLVTSKLQVNTDSNVETSVLLLSTPTSNSPSSSLSPMLVKLWSWVLSHLPPTTLSLLKPRLFLVPLRLEPTVHQSFLQLTGILQLIPPTLIATTRMKTAVNSNPILLPNKLSQPLECMRQLELTTQLSQVSKPTCGYSWQRKIKLTPDLRARESSHSTLHK